MANGNLDFVLKMIADTAGFNSGVSGAQNAVGLLTKAIAALGVGLGAKELIETADQYATLQGRIKNAVGETGNFREAMDGVYKVAISTNTSLESTASLFSSLNDAGKQMGLTQQQVLDLTKTINQAVQLGGGSAQASEAAITQLNQALSSGVLRGEELNSILEQAPAIAKALAASLGVTTGELRKMAENGELTSERVINALQQQSDSIQDQYSKLPTTVSQALQRIGTAWTQLIGQMNEETGATNSISSMLVYVADNLEELKPILNDVRDAVAEVIDQLSNNLSGDRLALVKDMAVQLYEAVKSGLSAIWEAGTTLNDVFGSALTSISSFFFGVDEGGKSIDLLSVALGTVNTVIGFISDGFKGAGIALNIVLGIGYKLSEWMYGLLSNIPGLGDRFANLAKIAAEQSKKYLQEAHDDAMKFQSDALKAAENAVKTEEQRNQEKIANNKKTLEQLKADDQAALTDQQANNEKRKQLDAQLNEAKKAGSLAEAARIREQLAELDKSDDQFSKKNIERQAERLKAAQELAAGAIKANGGVLDAATQQHLMSMGFFAQQSDAQRKAGEVTIKAMDDSSRSAEGFGLTAGEAAKRAAKGLGVDIPIALNEVTKGIVEGSKQVNTIAAGFDDLKKSGVDASALLVAGLDELIKKAKTTADIEALKNLINQLGSEGRLSINQVSVALDGLDKVAQKLPADISTGIGAAEALGVSVKKVSQVMSDDFRAASTNVQTVANDFKGLRGEGVNATETLIASLTKLGEKATNRAELAEAKRLWIEYGNNNLLSLQQVADGVDGVNAKLNKQTQELDAVQAAFKKFGLMGQEEARKVSGEYQEAFQTLVNSGQASAAQIEEAYKKWQRSVGDTSDATVQASLDMGAAMANVEQSNDRTTRSSDRISHSYDRVGDSALSAAQRQQQGAEAAIHSIDQWAAKLDEITRKQGGMTGEDFLNGGSSANSSVTGAQMLSYSQEQIAAKLEAMGYDKNKANDKAADIFKDQSWARGGVRIENGQLGLSKFGDLTNYDYVNAQLDKLSKISSASTGGGEPTRTTNVNLQLGGQTVPVTVNSGNETALLDLLKRAKMVS